MEKTEWYLFLGGSHHREWHSVPSVMNWVALLKADTTVFGNGHFFQGSEVPSVSNDKEGYVRSTVAIPKGTIQVFIADKEQNQLDYLISEYVKDLMGPQSGPKSDPSPISMKKFLAGPLVQVPDIPTEVKQLQEEGLTIVIGERVLHWEGNPQQLSGILSWAVQSLGPATETNKKVN